jgi:uncharacterized membrane protein
MNMRNVVRTFMTGLIAILPIFITIAMLIWLVGVTDQLLGGFVRLLLPGNLHFRGLGLVLFVLLVFASGVLMRGFFFRSLLERLDSMLNRIPLVKTVYSAVRDLTSFFSKSGSRRFSKVVAVQLPGFPVRLIGFVTMEDISGLPMQQVPNEVAVYLPMSYQIGGYTVFLPREYLTPLDMKLEHAMRLVVTAGLSPSEETAVKPVA